MSAIDHANITISLIKVKFPFRFAMFVVQQRQRPKKPQRMKLGTKHT